MLATVDRLSVCRDGRCVVEIKSGVDLSEWDGDESPSPTSCRCSSSSPSPAATTPTSSCSARGSRSSSGSPRDDELIAQMVEQLGAWWQRHIVDDVEPDATAGASTALARLYGNPDPDAVCDLPAELWSLREQVKILAAREAEIEKERKDLIARAKQAAGNASILKAAGETVATWNPTKKIAGATEDWRRANPTLVDQYTAEKTVEVLDVARLIEDHPELVGDGQPLYRVRQFRLGDSQEAEEVMTASTRARAAVEAAKTGADPNAAVAKVDSKNVEGGNPNVATFIKGLMPEIQRALPRGMDAERIARIALTEVRKSEREFQKGNSRASLAQCTPESFAGALLTSSALGLEPGVNGECYLVPYKGECTLIIGYQGLAKLFYQHPLARNLDAQAVYERDDFDFAYGTTAFLKHKPALKDRGAIIAYYAVAVLSTGASAFVVLTPDEIKALRDGKVGPQGKIADPQKWMERKTALRQLVKLLPKAANLQAAMAVDEQSGSELARRGVAQAIASDDTVPELPNPLDADDDVPPGVDGETGEVTDDGQGGFFGEQGGA
jgi:recombination protein RecT